MYRHNHGLVGQMTHIIEGSPQSDRHPELPWQSGQVIRDALTHNAAVVRIAVGPY
jgi:uncharacterized protein with HEPN domain